MSSSSDTVIISTVTILTTKRQAKRGCAPLINLFSSEDPEVCLDDWLPSLQCATQLNKWTAEEQLMQLTGHLKDHAFEE